MATANKGMSVFTMTMLTVAAVLSLRNLPTQADYGYSIIFYITAAAICFFVPSALVSAELASGWPEDGGVYLWVKQAFGPKWGFVAIFMQWVENLPWFPMVLTFVAAALAYAFGMPDLAGNKWFVFAAIIVTLWLSTWLNFHGVKLSAFLSSSGAMLGTVIPGVLIVALAIWYFAAGNAPVIQFSPGKLVPSLGNLGQLILLTNMMVALSGMEMSGIHVTEMRNPAKQFPKAIFIATALVIVLSILGALAIALVIPEKNIGLAAGVCQAFDRMFSIFHLSWLTPVVSILLAYGALTMVVTWVLGPSKGMLEVAKEGYLPKFWQQRNKSGMPARILILQATLSSLLATAVLFMPTINGAFILMAALTAQLYMIMYILMFAAVIRLRYSQPDKARPYRIPGGKPGVWIVAGIAFLTAFAAILVGFIPTEGVRVKGAEASFLYIAFLLFGMAFFVTLPLLCYHFYMKKDAKAAAAETKAAVKS
ncbi:MAG: amino acid permease [Lentisphaeria bacterium]|nr:amino acid permease [Lentisphaeria bacterium]